MKKLFSKAPDTLPPLSIILNDLIGSKSPESIAAHLDVSASTVRRWLSAGDAPRAVALALFWETRWGLSIIDCEAVNQARMQEGMNATLKRENATLRTRIARLEALGNGFGAANEPFSAVVNLNFLSNGSLPHAAVDGRNW
jgi:hypothetical protein